ncbi:hypothetical protein NC651_018799 [Populus alba x Populus x berolinensis]|nr:hypothetical protein NC651_018799 [Populus alba x Populus x berolinensis]
MSLFISGMEIDEDFRNLSEYVIHESSEIVVFLETMNRIRG